MKAELILVGKTTDKLFATGIADYADRITHYLSFSINTIPALKNTKNLSEEEQKKAEGELILRQLQPSDTVVLLDEHGAERTSMETAAWLQKKMQTARRLVFVIGGPRLLRRRISACQREDIALTHDLLTPDGPPDIHRTALSCLHHH